jgi:hypothetical protein
MSGFPNTQLCPKQYPTAIATTTTCSAAPGYTCPTRDFLCDISTEVPVYNLTGREGQRVCKVSLPPATVNATLFSDLALCCGDSDPATFRVQDNCVHYCASNQKDLNEYIHNFLIPRFLGFCQNVSEEVETGE